MQHLNSWHQPHHFQTAVQPPTQSVSPQPDLVFQRIQAGRVQYRGGLAPFPVYLTFVRKDTLKGSGAPAAVFQVAIGSHLLEAWVVPDSSGMPKIVHAQGGANKGTELTFVDPPAVAPPMAPSPQVAPPPVAPRVASYAEWARARSAQVSVFVSELGMHMPMGYIGDTTLFNGRPAALYELRLPVRTYRCMVAPSDRNGAPIVVAADRPALKSDFRVL